MKSPSVPFFRCLRLLLFIAAWPVLCFGGEQGPEILSVMVSENSGQIVLHMNVAAHGFAIWRWEPSTSTPYKNLMKSIATSRFSKFDNFVLVMDLPQAGCTYWYAAKELAVSVDGEVASESDLGRATSYTVDFFPLAPAVSSDDCLQSINLYWRSLLGFGVSDYEVWRGITPEINYSKLLAVVNGTHFSDTNCVQGQVYYYWIGARGPCGVNGPLNLAGSASVDPLPNLRPTGVTASNGRADGIQVTWDKISLQCDWTNKFSYEVWRNNFSKISGRVKLREVYTNSFLDVGPTATDQFGELETNKPYNYWVTTMLNGVRSAYSVSESGSMTILLPPTVISATRDLRAQAITVSWAAVPFAECYCVFRSTTNDLSTLKQIDTVCGLTYEDRDKSLLPGTLYYYWVKAINHVQMSEFSQSAVGELYGAPQKLDRWLRR